MRSMQTGLSRAAFRECVYFHQVRVLLRDSLSGKANLNAVNASRKGKRSEKGRRLNQTDMKTLILFFMMTPLFTTAQSFLLSIKAEQTVKGAYYEAGASYELSNKFALITPEQAHIFGR